MGSVLRRSGTALGTIANNINWRPYTVFHVGIGLYYKEVDVMLELWPDIKLLGMEPHPRVAKGLRKSYPGEFYECAMSNTSGTTTLYTKPGHKDGSSLYPHKNKKNQGERFEIQIEVRTLDELFPNLGQYKKPFLLWLDCEGSELKALQGGEKLLEHVDVLNVEMAANPPGVGWCTPWEVYDFLTERGFRLQHIHTQRAYGGQYDGVFVRQHLYRPEMSCSPCKCGL